MDVVCVDIDIDDEVVGVVVVYVGLLCYVEVKSVLIFVCDGMVGVVFGCVMVMSVVVEVKCIVLIGVWFLVSVVENLLRKVLFVLVVLMILFVEIVGMNLLWFVVW